MDARIERVESAAPARGGIRRAAPSNAWLVGDDNEVIVVDPGGDPEAVLGAVGDREVLAVICTHGHATHVAGAVRVAERDEAPVALHRRDLIAWRETHTGADPEITMEDGGVFGVADVTLEVIHAPGHSPGAVCLYCEALDAVLTGDVLVAGGPAAHQGEFPDFPAQMSSIGEHVLTLPGRTRVLPGHGEEITVADAEKRFDSWVSAGPTLAREAD